MSKDIVFLSHSSKDKKQLVQFKQALEEKTNGTIQFFLSSDGQSIPLGHNWISSIENALEKAKLAFLFLTANSVGSTWVAFEAGFMYSKKIRVIPVTLPGIEFAQVVPPISLLQGFNMHSYQAMNNIFEILNQVFENKHKPTFSPDDFRKIFGVDSEFGSGFFGEYSPLVLGIEFEGKIGQESLITKLEAELAKIEITLTKSKQANAEDRLNENVYTVAVCPGLRVSVGKERYSITLHGEMFAHLLAALSAVIANTCPPPYNATMNFIHGVAACGSEVHVSALMKPTLNTTIVLAAGGRNCVSSNTRKTVSTTALCNR